MDFKDILYLSIASSVGALLGLLKQDNKINARKIAIKLLSAIIIGVFIIPIGMEYWELNIRVWTGITAISSIIAEPIIDLLTDKLKTKLDEKI
jgi:TRAP-type C4-dicarboxylate transport system permease small subunit